MNLGMTATHSWSDLVLGSYEYLVVPTSRNLVSVFWSITHSITVFSLFQFLPATQQSVLLVFTKIGHSITVFSLFQFLPATQQSVLPVFKFTGLEFSPKLYSYFVYIYSKVVGCSHLIFAYTKSLLADYIINIKHVESHNLRYKD